MPVDWSGTTPSARSIHAGEQHEGANMTACRSRQRYRERSRTSASRCDAIGSTQRSSWGCSLAPGLQTVRSTPMAYGVARCILANSTEPTPGRVWGRTGKGATVHPVERLRCWHRRTGSSGCQARLDQGHPCFETTDHPIRWVMSCSSRSSSRQGGAGHHSQFRRNEPWTPKWSLSFKATDHPAPGGLSVGRMTRRGTSPTWTKAVAL